MSRQDQALVAALMLAALLGMAGYWLQAGGHRGRLVDADRAGPLPSPFQVDINRASWPELSQLPGIGQTLARRIVESREEAGPYRQPSDLQRVRGLGPKLLQRMEPYLLPVRAGGPSGP